MIFTGMFLLVFGILYTNQMTLIGEKEKDKRPGWACQLLGVGMIYFGWMEYQKPLMEILWQSVKVPF